MRAVGVGGAQADAGHGPGRMKLARRRMIGILAASALSCPIASKASSGATWRGRALGAEASITLADPGGRRAQAVISDCLQEIRRLESIFSLFKRDSSIVRLNREGRLDAAPSEMVELLNLARRLSALSGGAFDVTVQPLWQAYARGGDCRRHADALLYLVDWRGIHVDGRTVKLARPDMAITLNGIAQGYVTDRVADRLRAHGFERVLVHMGEYRGLGRRADGAPWWIGIGHPDGAGLIDQLSLDDQAVATSSPAGTPLDCAGGGATHLLDPISGRPLSHWRSVSVVADRAVIADGLSTAIAVAEPDLAQSLLDEGGGQRAFLLANDGRHLTLQSH